MHTVSTIAKKNVPVRSSDTSLRVKEECQDNGALHSKSNVKVDGRKRRTFGGVIEPSATPDFAYADPRGLCKVISDCIIGSQNYHTPSLTSVPQPATRYSFISPSSILGSQDYSNTDLDFPSGSLPHGVPWIYIPQEVSRAPIYSGLQDCQIASKFPSHHYYLPPRISQRLPPGVIENSVDTFESCGSDLPPSIQQISTWQTSQSHLRRSTIRDINIEQTASIHQAVPMERKFTIDSAQIQHSSRFSVDPPNSRVVACSECRSKSWVSQNCAEYHGS